MTLVKVVKSSSYFKRFQVKFRRRREGKTDYYARKRLITQAKNKYSSPKYRLVVRFTNRDIVCQIVAAKLHGDEVVAAAYSHELPRYGVKGGLTNWAAAYCTGLLVARRLIDSKEHLRGVYIGVEEPDGSYEITEPSDDGPRPFKAFLDVGLARTTTGCRIFAAMKGASDGGLFVPHSEKRFPGYDSESKELDTAAVRNYIFGTHVSEYMSQLEKSDSEKYKIQFARFIAAGITADNMEEMYAKAHEAIRADPSPQKKDDVTTKSVDAVKKPKRKQRLNSKQRREKALQKKNALFSTIEI